MTWHTAARDNLLIFQNAFFEHLKPLKNFFKRKPSEKTKEVCNILIS